MWCASSSIRSLITARCDLTDFEADPIQPLLPDKPRGVARVDDRCMLIGIFRVLRTGAPWHNLPERYGPLHDRLQPVQPMGQGGVDPSLSLRQRSRPTACVRRPLNHPHSSAGCSQKEGSDHTLGRSHEELSTKINAMIDARGLPLAIPCRPGRPPTRLPLRPCWRPILRPAKSWPTAAMMAAASSTWSRLTADMVTVRPGLRECAP